MIDVGKNKVKNKVRKKEEKLPYFLKKLTIQNLYKGVKMSE